MFKKTVTYEDFNGNIRTEDCYFNLTTMEVANLGIATADGKLREDIQTMVDTEDTIGMLNLYEKMILLAYGIKSEDGKTFKKSKEISDEFKESAAYNAIFEEICYKENVANEFLKNIMPANARAKIDEYMANNKQG